MVTGKLNFHIFVIAVFCSALSSCRTPPPPPAFAMEPAPGQKTRWDAGSMSIVQNSARTTAILTPRRRITNELQFSFTLTNTSSDTLEFRPERCYYVMSYRLDSIVPGTRIQARNPEAILDALDAQEAEENSRYTSEQNTDAVIGFLGFLFEVIAAVAGSDDDDKNRKCDNVHRSSSDNNTPSTNEITHRTTIAAINRARYAWTNSAARRTTLTPGGSLSGFLTFPMETGTRRATICVPVDGDTLRFDIHLQQVQ